MGRKQILRNKQVEDNINVIQPQENLTIEYRRSRRRTTDNEKKILDQALLNFKRNFITIPGNNFFLNIIN